MSSRVSSWRQRILAFSLAGACCAAGRAEDVSWVSRGPFDVAPAFSVAIDGSSAWVATPNGVFRSTDGGVSWQRGGLRGELVRAVAAAPGGNFLLAAVLSEDRTSLAAWISRDGGDTWSLVPQLQNVTEVATDPSHAGVAYATSGRDGTIFRTADAGKTWHPLPIRSHSSYSARIAFGGGTTYARVVDPTGTAYLLFRSRDSGLAWDAAAVPVANLLSIAGGSADGVVYAGGPDTLCRSADSAASWSCSAAPGDLRAIVEIDRGESAAPRLIALTFADGGHVSDDAGVTWTPLSQAPVGNESLRGAASNASGTLVLIGTSTTILRSVDAGSTWTRSASGVESSTVFSLAADPNDAAAIWADTGYVDSGLPHLFRSNDNGRHWSPAGAAGPIAAASLVVDPMDSATLYGGGSELLRSADGGESWTRSAFPTTDYFLTLAVNPDDGELWAGSGAGLSGLYRSADGGGTWSGPVVAQSIYSLLFDGRSPGTVHAGSHFDLEYGYYYPYPYGGALFTSRDGGATFAKGAHDFGSQVTAIAVDVADESALYVGTLQGVAVSSDGGATWTDAAEPRIGRVLSLIADPVRGGRLYAATDRGVFRSLDRARTWQPFTSGMGVLPVTQLAISADASTLFAASDGGGVFELDLTHDVPSLPCEPTRKRLCLVGNRYAVELMASRRSPDEPRAATAVSLSDLSGYFSLPFVTGDAELPEVFVKILGDGAFGEAGAVVYYASLTTLPWFMLVTDTATGRTERFLPRPGAPLCGGASRTFGAAVGPPVSSEQVTTASADETLHLLGGRFSVALRARRSSGQQLGVRAIPRTDRFGYFSFPGVVSDPSFPEVVVKMIDFRANSGKFWLFQTGLTTFDYTLEVTDTVTGSVRVYEGGEPFCGEADTAAFSD